MVFHFAMLVYQRVPSGAHPSPFHRGWNWFVLLEAPSDSPKGDPVMFGAMAGSIFPTVKSQGATKRVFQPHDSYLGLRTIKRTQSICRLQGQSKDFRDRDNSKCPWYSPRWIHCRSSSPRHLRSKPWILGWFIPPIFWHERSMGKGPQPASGVLRTRILGSMSEQKSRYHGRSTTRAAYMSILSEYIPNIHVYAL